MQRPADINCRPCRRRPGLALVANALVPTVLRVNPYGSWELPIKGQFLFFSISQTKTPQLAAGSPLAAAREVVSTSGGSCLPVRSQRRRIPWNAPNAVQGPHKGGEALSIRISSQALAICGNQALRLLTEPASFPPVMKRTALTRHPLPR